MFLKKFCGDGNNLLIYIRLLTIPCLHSNATVVIKTLVKSICLGVKFQQLTKGINMAGRRINNYADHIHKLTGLCDVINLLTPFLQAY